MKNEALVALNTIRENLSNKTFRFNLVESLDIIEKVLLKAETIENKLDRWIELLQIDGRNTKHQVLMEMKEIRGRKK